MVHLTAREYRIRYQSAFLGWLWALAPMVARFATLAVTFTLLLPTRTPHYLSELAVGLLGWTWFSSGVESATKSAADRRDLLAHVSLPRTVVPAVSVLTDALDYVAGVPVLLVVLLLDVGRIPATAGLLPLLLVLQGCLTLGLGMAAAVADVRLRDVRLAVGLALSIGFYATPVFYSLHQVGPRLAQILRWNPIGVMIEAQRAILIDGRLPSTASLAYLAVVNLCVLLVGYLIYRRHSDCFLDHL